MAKIKLNVKEVTPVKEVSIYEITFEGNTLHATWNELFEAANSGKIVRIVETGEDLINHSYLLCLHTYQNNYYADFVSYMYQYGNLLSATYMSDDPDSEMRIP